MDQMGGTRQPREMAKKRTNSFGFLPKQQSISNRVRTVFWPAFDPEERTDFTQPSSLMYISTGEQFKIFQKTRHFSNELLAAVISPKHPPYLHNQTSE